MRIQGLVLAAVTAIATVACQRGPHGRGGGPQAIEVADRIAGEQCARLERCADVGGDRRYVDRTACLNNQHVIARRELDAAECAGGVTNDRLEQCLEAIRFDDCAKSKLGVVSACESRTLCSR